MTTLRCPLADDEVLIFLHVPKTSGLSFGNNIQQQFRTEEVLISYTWGFFDDAPPDVLATYRLFCGHAMYSQIPQNGSRKPVFITILRDPVERALSFYAHVRRMNKSQYPEMARYVSFEEFLNNPRTHKEISNTMTRYIAGKPPEPADELDVAKAHLEAMPFFGLQDRFEDSVRLMNYTFAWERSFGVGDRNINPKRPTRDTISPDALAQVEAINQQDIALYNFARTIFARRYEQMLRETNRRPPEIRNDRPQLKRAIFSTVTTEERHGPVVVVWLKALYRYFVPTKARLWLRNLREPTR